MSHELSTWMGRSESEFDEAYHDARRVLNERFEAELLLESIEVLALPEPICVSPSDTVDTVAVGMAARNQGCVLVEEGGRLVGIFTERDFIRRVYGKVDPKATHIGHVMTRNPEAVSFHDSLAAALNKMSVGGYRHVPLVNVERRPVGVVSVKDIVHFLVSHFPRQVLTVSPDPANKRPDQMGGAG